jgi:phosphatidylserine/phosphatidylglycerophosphate/cardiolipin synthase-like enzyme
MMARMFLRQARRLAMFRFLARRAVESSDLLTSQLYDQKGFYPAFLRDLSGAVSEVIIESPFISHKRINALYPSFRAAAKRGVVIVINTRHPSEHDPDYAPQVARAITELQDLGVNVLFTGGHHRKLAIIDRHILWEGSLNILSQGDSCEIMRRIMSDVLVEQMIRFVDIERFL